MPVVSVVQATHTGVGRVGGRVHVVRVAVVWVWVLLTHRVGVRVWMGVWVGAWVGVVPVVEVGRVLLVIVVARG